MHRYLKVASLAAAFLGFSQPTQADNYPLKTVTVIVPSKTPSVINKLARLLANHLERNLSKPVAVEEIVGAIGILAARSAAQAPADGHTILFHSDVVVAYIGGRSASGNRPGLDQSPNPMDVRKALSPLGLVAYAPSTIIGSQKAPAAFELFAEELRKKKSPHIGVSGHRARICAAMLQGLVAENLELIPFPSAEKVIEGLNSQVIDVGCERTDLAAPYINAGVIHGYAVTASSRSPMLPSTPTTREAGFPGFLVENWIAAYVPKGTPEPVVQLLNAQIDGFLEDQETKKALEALGWTGFEKEMRSTDEHAKLLDDEIDYWN